jgi:hypothetical protein
MIRPLAGDLKLCHSFKRNRALFITVGLVEKDEGKIPTGKIFKNYPTVIQEIIPGLSL